MNSVFDLVADLFEEPPGGCERPEPEPRPPVAKVENRNPTEREIMGALEIICHGIEGITAREFREQIDDDEALWIATGRIPLDYAIAYARIFAGKSWLARS